MIAPTELVQWILLPGGLTADGQLAASVFVAPRLRPEPRPASPTSPTSPTGPALLGGLELAVVRPDGVTEAPISMAIEASRTYWGRAVPAGPTVVRAFAFDDLADRPLVSYPARRCSATCAIAGRSWPSRPVTSSR